MFVVLEGGDGTGKSTLTTQLANQYAGEAYSTPPEKFRKYRSEMDRVGTPEEHYSFYREAVLVASDEINSLKKDSRMVFCDRYWISTVTYHEVMGLTVNHHDFNSIVKPDITILLVTSPNEQIRRMVTRGMSPGDKRMLDKQQEITTRLFQNLVLTNSPFISLDTGRFSIDECVKIIGCALK
jgi:thymidylate kinase